MMVYFDTVAFIPPWKCARCGYLNAGLFEVCYGAKGCTGRRPATQAGKVSP